MITVIEDEKHVKSLVESLVDKIGECENVDIEEFRAGVKDVLITFGYTFDLFDISVEFKSNRKPLIILLGGTSGCGKSTLGSLLASRLGISTVISTDHIRQLVRSLIPKNHILNCSSYNITDDCDNVESVIDAYETQTEELYPHINKVVQYHLACKNCLIIEGVHLSIKTIEKLFSDNQTPFVMPFIIYISNKVKHSERFAIRAKYMTLEPRKNKYMKYFNSIRAIQNHLISTPIMLGDDIEHELPRVDNTNVDKSIVLIHQTILLYLKNLNTSHVTHVDNLSEAFNETLKKNNWGSKEMLMEIKRRKGGGSAALQDKEVEMMFQQFSETHALGSLGS